MDPERESAASRLVTLRRSVGLIHHALSAKIPGGEFSLKTFVEPTLDTTAELQPDQVLQAFTSLTDLTLDLQYLQQAAGTIEKPPFLTSTQKEIFDTCYEAIEMLPFASQDDRQAAIATLEGQFFRFLAHQPDHGTAIQFFNDAYLQVLLHGLSSEYLLRSDVIEELFNQKTMLDEDIKSITILLTTLKNKDYLEINTDLARIYDPVLQHYAIDLIVPFAINDGATIDEMQIVVDVVLDHINNNRPPLTHPNALTDTLDPFATSTLDNPDGLSSFGVIDGQADFNSKPPEAEPLSEETMNSIRRSVDQKINIASTQGIPNRVFMRFITEIASDLQWLTRHGHPLQTTSAWQAFIATVHKQGFVRATQDLTNAWRNSIRVQHQHYKSMTMSEFIGLEKSTYEFLNHLEGRFVTEIDEIDAFRREHLRLFQISYERLPQMFEQINYWLSQDGLIDKRPSFPTDEKTHEWQQQAHQIFRRLLRETAELAFTQGRLDIFETLLKSNYMSPIDISALTHSLASNYRTESPNT
jgi:hypothetical protein